MDSALLPAPVRSTDTGGRDGLLRLLGWRAVLLQQDPPTWDRYRWLRRHLRPGALRTLDAGSGSGGFALFAAVQGNDVLGLSFDDAANARAMRRADLLGIRRVRFRTLDLRQLNNHLTELGTFDQILCLETIEHLLDDTRLIVGLSSLLRPGGTLLLTTPFAAHRALVGETLSPVEDGGHVRWGYSDHELDGIFSQAGLRLTSVEYLSGVVTQRATNLSRLIERITGVHLAWALTAPLRLLRPLDGPATRAIGYPRLAIAVVGVKP